MDDFEVHLEQTFPQSDTCRYLLALLRGQNVSNMRENSGIDGRKIQLAVHRCTRLFSNEYLNLEEPEKHGRTGPLDVNPENSPVFAALLVAFTTETSTPEK